MRNFEKSFGSTLRTLRLINESHVKKGGHRFKNLDLEGSTSAVTLDKGLINESHVKKGGHHCNNLNVEGSTSAVTLDKGGCTSNSGIEDFQSKAILQKNLTHDRLNDIEEVRENILTDSNTLELALIGQTNQVTGLFPSTSGSAIEQSIQKSLIEQTRSNNLKTLELGLTMRKLELKETQLGLNFESNYLETLKLTLNKSKASFKAEKFQTQLEDTRNAELLRKCIDCLVAGLFIMSTCVLYGAYVFSYQRITEATESCTPSPKARVQVLVDPKPNGIFQFRAACPLVSGSSCESNVGWFLNDYRKLCVDTFGGSGYHWLLYWEILCLLHFFFNVCTSTLYSILYGPVNLSQGTKGQAIFPYWIRRFLFYTILLVVLPLLCGLVPFASLGEWKDHLLLKITDYLFTVDKLSWEQQDEL
uniref:Uncharacterized protein n=1 Tax=Fagus sylvatica TaxID=28930 RepID=A0A2N9EUE6_FAGSY